MTRASAARMGLAIVMMTIGAAADTAAATNQNARLAIHLTAPITKSPCTAAAALPACEQVRTNGGPGTWYAFVLLTNGSATAGVSSVDFGIDYDDAPGRGVDIFDWNACGAASLVSGSWPSSGSGVRLTWNVCQNAEPGGVGSGVKAVAGYFYLSAYSPDVLQLTPHPDRGSFHVEDCAHIGGDGGAGGPSPPFGSAVFSASALENGWNPCEPYPVTYQGCTISGPPFLIAGSSGVEYSVVDPVPGLEYHWFTEFDLVIQGASVGPSVRVGASRVGFGFLNVSTMGTSPIVQGHKSVSIQRGHVPIESTSWSRIKLLAD